MDSVSLYKPSHDIDVTTISVPVVDKKRRSRLVISTTGTSSLSKTGQRTGFKSSSLSRITLRKRVHVPREHTKPRVTYRIQAPINIPSQQQTRVHSTPPEKEYAEFPLPPKHLPVRSRSVEHLSGLNMFENEDALLLKSPPHALFISGSLIGATRRLCHSVTDLRSWQGNSKKWSCSHHTSSTESKPWWDKNLLDNPFHRSEGDRMILPDHNSHIASSSDTDILSTSIQYPMCKKQLHSLQRLLASRTMQAENAVHELATIQADKRQIGEHLNELELVESVRAVTVLSLKNKIAELYADIESLRCAHSRSIDHQADLQEEVNSLKKSRNWYHEQLRLAQAVRDQSEIESDRLRGLFRESGETNHRLSHENASLQAQLVCCRASLADAKRNLSQQLDSIRVDMIEREVIFERLANERADMEDIHLSRSDEVSQWQMEVHNLKNELGVTDQQVISQRLRLDQLETALADAESNRSALQDMLLNIETQHQQQEMQLRDYSNQCDEAMSRVRTLEADCTHKDTLLALTLEEKQTLSAALTAARNEKDTLNTYLCSLKDNLTHIEESFDKLRNELSVKASSITSLTEQRDDVLKQLDQFQVNFNDSEHRINELQHANKDLSHQCDNLRQQLADRVAIADKIELAVAPQVKTPLTVAGSCGTVAPSHPSPQVFQQSCGSNMPAVVWTGANRVSTRTNSHTCDTLLVNAQSHFNQTNHLHAPKLTVICTSSYVMHHPPPMMRQLEEEVKESREFKGDIQKDVNIANEPLLEDVLSKRDPPSAKMDTNDLTADGKTNVQDENRDTTTLHKTVDTRNLSNVKNEKGNTCNLSSYFGCPEEDLFAEVLNEGVDCSKCAVPLDYTQPSTYELLGGEKVSRDFIVDADLIGTTNNAMADQSTEQFSSNCTVIPDHHTTMNLTTESAQSCDKTFTYVAADSGFDSSGSQEQTRCDNEVEYDAMRNALSQANERLIMMSAELISAHQEKERQTLIASEETAAHQYTAEVKQSALIDLECARERLNLAQQELDTLRQECARLREKYEKSYNSLDSTNQNARQAELKALKEMITITTKHIANLSELLKRAHREKVLYQSELARLKGGIRAQLERFRMFTRLESAGREKPLPMSNQCQTVVKNLAAVGIDLESLEELLGSGANISLLHSK